MLIAPYAARRAHDRFHHNPNDTGVQRCFHFSLGHVPSLARREEMNGVELVGLVTSVLLLVYLTIALLKPEWFS
jgi:K+-transporting ATPase KdpF subunit